MATICWQTGLCVEKCISMLQTHLGLVRAKETGNIYHHCNCILCVEKIILTTNKLISRH